MPNDPEVLRKAADAAGLDGKAFVADANMNAAETTEEFKVGRQLRVTGVPHFVITADGSGKAEQISGAQPPEEFTKAFHRIAKQGGASPKREACLIS
mmetsp:Transcript_99536/g.172784  ORF Transcript_99536/g.172784 Transcript_99536/m.172784 type:complete len:97 (-) Transcript_99536:19-309(-)